MTTSHTDDTPIKDNTIPTKHSRNGGRSSSRSPSREEKSDKSHVRSVDFDLNFLASIDPAESKLLNDLESGQEYSTQIPPMSSSTTPPKPPKKGHHRGASRRLQQFVKQLSVRKSLTGHHRSPSYANNEIPSSTYGSHDDNDLFRVASATSDDGVPPLKYNNSLDQMQENAAMMNGMSQSAGGTRTRFASMDGSATRRASRRQRSNTSGESGNAAVPASEFLANLADELDEKSNGFGDFFSNGAAGSSRRREKSDPLSSPSPRKPAHRRQRTTTDALMDHAMYLEQLFKTGPDEALPHEFSYPNPGDNQHDPSNNGLGSPTVSDISDHDRRDDNNQDDDGVGDGPDNVRRPLLGRRQQPPTNTNPLKAALLEFIKIIGPWDIWNGICHFLLYRFLLLIVPLLSLSAVLFYFFDNPRHSPFESYEFHLSWALIFVSRLLVTFGLAEATQYTLEVFTIRTTIIVRVAGPFMALVCMQSVGWPFLIASWGTWTGLIMRGSGNFSKNWLWFLGIGMFSPEQNSDYGLLNSVIYGRILLAMVFVGVATAAKRTAVALYLSRRMLQYYRKQLHDLLADIKVVMEVAELAAETENEEFAELLEEEIRFQTGGSRSSAATGGGSGGVQLSAFKKANSASKLVPTLSAPSPSSMDDIMIREFSTDEDDEDDTGSLLLSDHETSHRNSHGSSPLIYRGGHNMTKQNSTASGLTSAATSTKGPIQWNELYYQAKPSPSRADRSMSPIEMATSAGEVKRTHRPNTSSRGIDTLVPRLDNWEEPETKGAKKDLPSLHDILQFRKAMDFMETPFPFSAAFGPARTRRECIRSSVRCYRRLLRFTPGEADLDFNVIGALAYDGDGNALEDKARALVKVFIPEKDNLIHQLEFVRAVDYVYKSLRFLRASIINSTKIDSVLENFFDVIFNGILAILVMTLLGLNPWPLLVSFSTVMVSFAFSFGPSCAKYIEGIMMIAVRRPYDIGDRITIISGEALSHPTSNDTWLVEDISLSTTTLRYGATNEISTINNASIANSRIVNGARSPKAIVNISINFKLQSTQAEIEIFRDRVEFFLLDRPEIWSGLVHFRNDAVDFNGNFVTYLLRVQHNKSWQDMPPIMVHRGELERYCTKVAVDLDIAWLSSHHRIRIVEVPPIQQAKDEDDVVAAGAGKSGTGKREEPFMKFMKAETGN